MTVKVGIIGMGGLGTLHFGSFANLPEARIVAMCDIREERMQSGASASTNISSATSSQDTSGVKKYKDYNRLLRDPNVEMVLTALPTNLHHTVAVKALKAGKHLFSEKPMAISSRAAAKMAAAAEESGKFMMIGHCLRFWPEYVYIKETIDSGRLGKVQSVLFRRLSALPSWSWDGWLLDTPRSGAVALDMHIHDVDTAQWYFGKPTHVYSTGTQRADGGYDHIFTHYVYPGGPRVIAEGGWNFPKGYPFQMVASVAFEKGSIEFHYPAPEGGSTLTEIDGEGRKTQPQVSGESAYWREMKYFINCVQTGAKPDRIPNDQAVTDVAIVEAEIKSANTGRVVAVK